MTRPRSLIVLQRTLALFAALVLLGAALPAGAVARDSASERYLVVFGGDYALDGDYALGAGYALGPYTDLTSEYALGPAYALGGEYALENGYALTVDYALYALYALDDAYALAGGYALDGGYALPGWYALDGAYALAREYALQLVDSAGGTVTSDLSRQLGVMVVDSKNEAFAQTMSEYALVEAVGRDFAWKQFPTYEEAIASGALTIVDEADVAPGGGDPLEALQWNMRQIRAPEARAGQAGSPTVDVGVIDTGIDVTHVDFISGSDAKVDCKRGADFTAQGPGIGSPVACVDNNFHGTHVAGIIAARANGHGIVGVAPEVTLVPIKVCDADGHCYASDVVEGISHAGDEALDVINMSFFVDDDEFQASTEFKCADDPAQRAFRKATERAIHYVRQQGGTPVAALGNSDTDLNHPDAGNACDVVPAETSGVVGTAALGPESEKARYSNWGTGATDIAAPGGHYVVVRDAPETICQRAVISTIPGNGWGCFQGTSMASPHAAGVAALIVSQFGKADGSGGLTLSPTSVESHLQKTAIDIGLSGKDECFGHGRIDALRAVQGQTSKAYDADAPFCPEYEE